MNRIYYSQPPYEVHDVNVLIFPVRKGRNRGQILSSHTIKRRGGDLDPGSLAAAPTLLAAGLQYLTAFAPKVSEWLAPL